MKVACSASLALLAFIPPAFAIDWNGAWQGPLDPPGRASVRIYIKDDKIGSYHFGRQSVKVGYSKSSPGKFWFSTGSGAVITLTTAGDGKVKYHFRDFRLGEATATLVSVKPMRWRQGGG